MSEYGLKLARETLKRFGVPFTEVRHAEGTSMLFPDCEMAWAAYDVLELKGAGPRMLGDGKAEIIFYD